MSNVIELKKRQQIFIWRSVAVWFNVNNGAETSMVDAVVVAGALNALESVFLPVAERMSDERVITEFVQSGTISDNLLVVFKKLHNYIEEEYLNHD